MCKEKVWQGGGKRSDFPSVGTNIMGFANGCNFRGKNGDMCICLDPRDIDSVLKISHRPMRIVENIASCMLCFQL